MLTGDAEAGRPALTGDAEGNRRTVQDCLDGPPGVLELPAGDWPVAGGLDVPAGWTVRAEPGRSIVDGGYLTKP